MAPNCPNRSKQVQICQNRSKWIQIVHTFPKETKQVRLGQLGLNRTKWVQMGPQRSQIGVQNNHEPNQMAFKPRSPRSCLPGQFLQKMQFMKPFFWWEIGWCFFYCLPGGKGKYQKARRMINGLVLTFLFSIKKTPSYFSHKKKGFINYVFCRNWAVRNPARARLPQPSK